MVRPVNTSAQNIRERRSGLSTRVMIYFEAQNRSDNTPVDLGLWTGEDTESITFTDMWTGASLTRTFYGAGTLLGVETPRYYTGFEVRPITITLSSISSAVTNLIRAYEPRGAKAQILLRSYEPDTMEAVAIEPVWKGFVNRAPIPRPAPGEAAEMSVQLVSSARLLTIPFPRKKSNANQVKRAGDKFLRYAGAAEILNVPWGLEDDRKR